MLADRWRAFCEEFLLRWGAGGALPDVVADDVPRWYDLPFWC